MAELGVRSRFEGSERESNDLIFFLLLFSDKNAIRMTVAVYFTIPSPNQKPELRSGWMNDGLDCLQRMHTRDDVESFAIFPHNRWPKLKTVELPQQRKGPEITLLFEIWLSPGHDREGHS